jgi:uncharacterized membrane protein YheB (UPF0754 family)
MNYWHLIIPFISALLGWVLAQIAFHLLFSRFLPGKQAQLSSAVGKRLGEIFSLQPIQEKISSPAQLQKIMPMIEDHIDVFLRERLGKEMPMISMFIGDKTIAKMKSALMKEIETLFPQVMDRFATNLQSEINIEKMITDKLSSYSISNLESYLSKEKRMTAMTGALIGLIIGIVNLLLILIFNS